MDTQPPVILLVYANDRVDPSRHLRNLSVEIGLIRDALQPAEQAGLCQVLIEANAGADRIFSVFQDARYRHRIAVLHYAGHADEYRLLLESAAGGTPSDQGAAHAAGLAAFLGGQQGLELVFLNGCSTAPQVQGLLDAGCPTVIATSQAIDDGVATEFAAHFYQGLGGGGGLRVRETFECEPPRVGPAEPIRDGPHIVHAALQPADRLGIVVDPDEQGIESIRVVRHREWSCGWVWIGYA